MFRYDGKFFEFAREFRGEMGIHVALWNALIPGYIVSRFRRDVVELDVVCRHCGRPLGDRPMDMPMRNLCDGCFNIAVNVMTEHSPTEVLSWKTGDDSWSHEGAHDELQEEFEQAADEYLASATIRALKEGNYDFE